MASSDLSAIFKKVNRQSVWLAGLEKSGWPRLVKKVIFKLYEKRADYFLYRSDKRSLPKLERDINELKSGIEHEDFIRHRFPKLVYNQLFFAIAIKDIMLTHHQFMAAKNSEERNLLARSLVLHLHEYIQDFQKLTGKSFRQQLQTIPYPDPILKEFDSLKLGYKNISQQYIAFLQEVRHTSIGHKTKEVKVLINTIQTLDTLHVREISTMSLLLHALYHQFNQSITKHLMQYPNEIARMPYLPADQFQ